MKSNLNIKHISHIILRKIKNEQLSYEVWDTLPCVTYDSCKLDINSVNFNRMEDFSKATANDKEMRIAIRGDGNCGKRTLIWGTLIEAATRIKSGNTERKRSGYELLERIRSSVTKFNSYKELYKEQYESDKVPEYLQKLTELHDEYFQEKQSQDILSLFNQIKENKILVSELIYLANSDYSIRIDEKPLSLSLSLSALASFMMLQGIVPLIKAKFDMDNLDIEESAGYLEINLNELLSLGVSSRDPDRLAFAQQANIKLKQHMMMQDKNNNQYRHEVILEEQKKIVNIPEITCATISGHTVLIVNEKQQKVIAAEVKEFTLNSTLPTVLYDRFTKLEIGGSFHKMICLKQRQRVKMFEILAKDFFASQLPESSILLDEKIRRVITNIIPEEMKEDFAKFVLDFTKTIENSNEPAVYSNIKLIDRTLSYIISLCANIKDKVFPNIVKSALTNGFQDLFIHIAMQNSDDILVTAAILPKDCMSDKELNEELFMSNRNSQSFADRLTSEPKISNTSKYKI